MNGPSTSLKKANYGLDAPTVVRGLFLAGMILLGLGAVSILLLKKGFPHWMPFIAGPALGMGCTLLLEAGVMFWGSKIGKLRLRDKVIAAIPWRGDEVVLDVGCGHGLMLIGAARRLSSGKAVGIDLWQKVDQAGNSCEATWRNVECEGVAANVELQDGDARKLPFADNAFDVVLSSWALHNIYDKAGRDTAVREIVRVLKPGGRLAIIDIRHTKEYEQVLGECQLADINRAGPNFLFVISTFTLTATKPG